MRRLWILVLAAGCKTILGIDDPIVAQGPADGPASKDGPGPGDGPSDGTAGCPAAPLGCTLFACTGRVGCLYDCGHDTRRTWTGANGFCAAQGLGCLARIDGPSDNACIAQQVLPGSASNDIVWFGYAQAATGAEPSVGWSFTCGSSTYVNWGITEPNQLTGDEDCASMHDSSGVWSDDQCGNAYRFVCSLP
jgi:hypothetical protein